ncbi:hypothetical protein [Pedosphaera parvula]|uniref:Uncharacterized protein n=1 Tax=Pedosphaera parvula (strain Ellin514) TaxID=320771 RepID=B9XEM1_PEDPL|nr:hypothetical protein [Pedosphaera parvula]EEF61735.1 hypothetical protein Cflav_PD4775 [Pedosphaera parvula Ellin514]
MAKQKQQKQPSFFWQGLLILLPVVVLTLFGILALLQNQALAAQRAREGAKQVAAVALTAFEQSQVLLQASNALYEANLDPQSRGPSSPEFANSLIFCVNSKNELIHPEPLEWPSQPTQLLRTENQLGPQQSKEWQAAEAALSRGDWPEAAQTIWNVLCESGSSKIRSAPEQWTP